MNSEVFITVITVIGSILGSKALGRLYKFVEKLYKLRTEQSYQAKQDIKTEKKTKSDYLEDRITNLEQELQITKKENKIELEQRNIQLRQKEEEITKLTLLLMQSVVVLQESLASRPNKVEIRNKTDDIIKELEILKEITFQRSNRA